MVVREAFDREQTMDRVVKLGPDWLVEQGEVGDVMGTRTHGGVD